MVEVYQMCINCKAAAGVYPYSDEEYLCPTCYCDFIHEYADDYSQRRCPECGGLRWFIEHMHEEIYSRD